MKINIQYSGSTGIGITYPYNDDTNVVLLILLSTYHFNYYYNRSYFSSFEHLSKQLGV